MASAILQKPWRMAGNGYVIKLPPWLPPKNLADPPRFVAGNGYPAASPGDSFELSACSSTDRASASGAGGTGSIPVRRIILIILRRGEKRGGAGGAGSIPAGGILLRPNAFALGLRRNGE